MDVDPGDIEEEVIAEPEETAPTSSVVSGLLFLQANGWYILILSLLLYYLWKSKISQYVEKLRKTREEEDEEAKCKKDPDLYRAREEARMAAIQKLQNMYNEQAVIMKEKMEERERKKKEELFAKHPDVTVGRKLNEDFNPLSGSGGPSYRAPRRTCPSCPSSNR